jgi:cardiolipin synthase
MHEPSAITAGLFIMDYVFSIIATAIGAGLLVWSWQSWRTARKFTRKLIVAVLATVAATALAGILYLNVRPAEHKVKHRVESKYSVADPEFIGSMGALLGPQLLGHNDVTILRNGDEFFPDMLRSIRAAQHTICFETYIYWAGQIGGQFADALAERARAGVKVHVLLDWVGSIKMSDELITRMKTAGVEVERYHPLRWYTLDRLNNRTHRKLLIIDGRIGYTGGAGISDTWLGHAQDKDHWRDNQYRLVGPSVAQMQAAFMDNWLKTHAEVHHGKSYFPVKLETTGTMLAQVFKSSASEGSESARLMFLLSIAAAHKSLLIANSYFVPDDLLVDMMVSAAKRGVNVEVILPGKYIDAKVTKRAMRARWGKLLQAGVKIYEYQPTLFHCKYMIVDGLWTSVGSTNFDNRSFRLNDEANLNVLDEAFAREHTKVFEEDKKQSRMVSYSEWKNRGMMEKMLEKFASGVRSQL